MAENDDTLIINFLRGRFARVDEEFTALRTQNAEVIARLDASERGQADLRRTIAELHAGLVALTRRPEVKADADLLFEMIDDVERALGARRRR